MGVKKTDYTVYYQQAEKMIPWSLSFEDWSKGKQSGTDKFIEVPPEEWDEAKVDLTCRMLIKEHGFVIRACILMDKKTVFNPEIRLKDARPIQKQQGDNEFGVGKRFRVLSTSTRLEISKSEKESLEMTYPDGEKFPFRTTVSHVTKSLNIGTWIRI